MSSQNPAEKIRVGCKVNLGLRITGVRPDGYHQLLSLFCPLPEPWDELLFEPQPGTQMTVMCRTKGIAPDHNTLTKAHAAFAALSGFAPGVRVTLHKGIPHGAGLGGGSADAAAVLRWCNTRIPQPLNAAALEKAALTVGADVPFFLRNQACMVQGIGEQLTPCAAPWPGCWLVLLCPPVLVSTPWAYGAWDQAQRTDTRDLHRFSQHFLKAVPESLTSEGLGAKEIDSCEPRPVWLVNDFELPVFKAHPSLRQLKESLLRQGAEAAVMSGSGASLVGLFRQESAARRAAQNLQHRGRVFVAAL